MFYDIINSGFLRGAVVFQSLHLLKTHTGMAGGRDIYTLVLFRKWGLRIRYTILLAEEGISLASPLYRTVQGVFRQGGSKGQKGKAFSGLFPNDHSGIAYGGARKHPYNMLYGGMVGNV